MIEQGPRPLSWARLALAAIGEPVVRAASWLAPLAGRDRDGVEQVLRGLLLGGSSRWRVGRGVRFVGPPSRFRLGPSVALYGNSYLNANGPSGLITIGAGSHVDQFCVLYGQGGLRIGCDCAIASGAIVYSQTNDDALHDGTPVARQPTAYAEVVIGDGVWLGAGVRILPGVTIETGAHVGSGAVVRGRIPENSVAVGVPARVVATRQLAR